MLATNYTSLRNKLKEYCDLAVDENETVVVTRKDDKNLVLISLERYNVLTKAMANADYLEKLELSAKQISQGQTIVKKLEDLELMGNG